MDITTLTPQIWVIKTIPNFSSALSMEKLTLYIVTFSPDSQDSLLLIEAFLHQGWMNEIYNYDPETYHATLTHSVFVRLEGGTLRLSKPNKNISRRASYNETKPEVTYISQKIYDLSDSKVSLGHFGSRAR